MAPTPDFTDDGLLYMRVTQDSLHNTPTTDLEYNKLQDQYRQRTDNQYSRLSSNELNKELSVSRHSLKSVKNHENQSWVRRNWGWIITLCCFVYLFMYQGFLCCFSLLFVYLQEDFRSSATETGWVGNIAFALSNLATPFANYLIFRLRSTRLVVFIGVIMCTVGLVSSSFVTNIYYLYGTLGVLAGLGINLVYHSTQVLLVQYFPGQNCTSVVSLSSCGTPLGLLVLSQIMDFAMASLGWRETLRYFGIISGAICSLLCIPLLPAPDSSYQLPQDTPDDIDDDKEDHMEEGTPCLEHDPTLQKATMEYLELPSCVPSKEQKVKTDFYLGSPPSLVVTNEQRDNDQVYFETPAVSLPQKPTEEKKTDFYLESPPTLVVTNEHMYDQVFFDSPPVSLSQKQTEEKKTCSKKPLSSQSSMKDTKPLCEKDRKVSEVSMASTITTFKSFIMLPTAWITSGAFLLSCVAQSFHNVNLVGHLRIQGLTEHSSTVLIGLAIGELVSKLGLGIFGHKFKYPKVYLMSVSQILVGAFTLVLGWSSDAPVTMSTAAMIGLFRSGYLVLGAPVLIETFGITRIYDAAASMMLSSGTGYLLGSVVMGMSYDYSGSYLISIILATTLFTIAGALFISVELRHKCTRAGRQEQQDLHQELDIVQVVGMDPSGQQLMPWPSVVQLDHMDDPEHNARGSTFIVHVGDAVTVVDVEVEQPTPV